jgi:hypothetical protein
MSPFVAVKHIIHLGDIIKVPHDVSRSEVVASLSTPKPERASANGKYDFEVNESLRDAKLRRLRPGSPPA